MSSYFLIIMSLLIVTSISLLVAVSRHVWLFVRRETLTTRDGSSTAPLARFRGLSKALFAYWSTRTLRTAEVFKGGIQTTLLFVGALIFETVGSAPAFAVGVAAVAGVEAVSLFGRIKASKGIDKRP